MKSISEVTKLTGVTRRTLQEYDRIGLLTPTKKGDGNNNYWYYDNESVLLLILIQSFVRCGYERKEIKAILEKKDFDLDREYEVAIERLEKQKDEIDAMIWMLERRKTIKLPDCFMDFFSVEECIQLYETKSEREIYDETISWIKEKKKISEHSKNEDGLFSEKELRFFDSNECHTAAFIIQWLLFCKIDIKLDDTAYKHSIEYVHGTLVKILLECDEDDWNEVERTRDYSENISYLLDECGFSKEFDVKTLPDTKNNRKRYAETDALCFCLFIMDAIIENCLFPEPENSESVEDYIVRIDKIEAKRSESTVFQYFKSYFREWFLEQKKAGTLIIKKREKNVKK